MYSVIQNKEEEKMYFVTKNVHETKKLLIVLYSYILLNIDTTGTKFHTFEHDRRMWPSASLKHTLRRGPQNSATDLNGNV